MDEFDEFFDDFDDAVIDAVEQSAQATQAPNQQNKRNLFKNEPSEPVFSSRSHSNPVTGSPPAKRSRTSVTTSHGKDNSRPLYNHSNNNATTHFNTSQSRAGSLKPSFISTSIRPNPAPTLYRTDSFDDIPDISIRDGEYVVEHRERSPSPALQPTNPPVVSVQAPTSHTVLQNEPPAKPAQQKSNSSFSRQKSTSALILNAVETSLSQRASQGLQRSHSSSSTSSTSRFNMNGNHPQSNLKPRASTSYTHRPEPVPSNGGSRASLHRSTSSASLKNTSVVPLSQQVNGSQNRTRNTGTSATIKMAVEFETVSRVNGAQIAK